MTVSILADGVEIVEKHIRFSDGGSNIKITTGLSPKNIVVTIKNEPVDSYLYLLNIITRLMWNYYTNSKVICHLPYLPHGRADRAFEEGMICPLREIAYALKGFHEVIIRDPHSGRVKEWIDRDPVTKYTEISQLRSFLDCPFGLEKYDFDVLVSPDKGAKEKTQTIADQLKVPVVFCEKDRDPATGHINKVDVHGDVQGKVCLITDDICDGGGTFLLTAMALKDRGAADVKLYVTHGIFSKGLDIFRGLVSNVFCYHTVMNYVTMKDIHEFNKENSK